MIITGTVILVEPGTDLQVREALERFPGVTFQARSDSGTEWVINIETDDLEALERTCEGLKERIPRIIDISHVYVNFEEEIDKALSGETD